MNRNERALPRLMIAAPASGAGKTTLTVGLLQCLKNRGLAPTAFKCGPDYIDPLFHREVLGVPSYNLDLFFTPPETVRGLLCRYGVGDVALLEGVMGYYDGVSLTDRASSWRLAVETDTPVVLTLPAPGASVTLAATVQGIVRFREGSMVAGVVLNRCGERLFATLAPVLERECGIPVLGHLPALPEAEFPSRHLGLVTPEHLEGVRGKLAALGDAVTRTVDVDALLALASDAPPIAGTLPAVQSVATPAVRIAVARDAAFTFYYEENLDLLRGLGAELVFFSPLADSGLPPDMAGLYLGGGYPELFAEALAANIAMRHCLREAVASGLPTVAECGGFLYLHQELRDKDGVCHPMVRALPGCGYPAEGLRHFGYAELTALEETLLLSPGDSCRVHEFHYWRSDSDGEACMARKPDARAEWRCCRGGPTLHAGFPHLYFWNHPAMAERFVQAAAKRRTHG